MNDAQMITEIGSLKAKLRATWTAGDFAEIARSFEQGAIEFVDRLALRPGTRVLDVACGDGNTALPAARKGAAVTGIDLAPYLVEQARKRAREAGLAATFDVGDAESLPYANAEFDAVITMFGAMFAPRPEVTTAELLRVCRPGGMIAMANWTREGFIGQMFARTGKFVPPPAMPSSLLWGDEEAVRNRLEVGISGLRMERRLIDFVFPFGPNEVVEHFRKYYGPTQKAFEALGSEDQAALRQDMEDLWSANNISDDGTTIVRSEYLEIIAERA
jgi:2-polyprenyl-3-methyl-5-hydroxy-6-metoxy-1,4-benzoquinol methylase